MEVRRYLMILEGNDEEGFSAYSPDVPGCVAAGETREETEHLFREALALHLAGLREDHLPLPEPTSVAAEYVEYVEAER